MAQRRRTGLEVLEQKLESLRHYYRHGWSKMPLAIVGATSLQHCAEIPPHATSEWISVGDATTRMLDSALGDFLTFASFNFEPRLVTAIPSSDQLGFSDLIRKEAKILREQWKTDYDRVLHFDFLPKDGDCSLVLIQPVTPAKKPALFFRAGCLRHLSWKDVMEKVPPEKGPGVLLLKSLFFSSLHKGLDEALEAYSDWLVCVDYGRFSRHSNIRPETVEEIRNNLHLVDLQFTSKVDLWRLLVGDLPVGRAYNADSALDVVFDRLREGPSPAVVVAKTEGQARRLWLNNGNGGGAFPPYKYTGMDLTGIGYPHVGAVFNAAFIAALLSSDTKLDIARRCDEATIVAMDALSVWCDELIAAQGNKETHRPLERVLKQCGEINEKERRGLQPLGYLREFGCLDGLVGFRSCPEVKQAIRRACSTNFSVIIHGPAGSGKDFLARYIHENSSKKEGKFVDIRLQGENSELQRSELFGSKGRKIFTDDVMPREGLLTKAKGGTAFLNDLQDIRRDVAAQLMSALETDPKLRKILPYGGHPDEHIDLADVRYISAFNKDIDQLPEIEKQFYFRLSQIEIVIPPLHERLEDIRPLACHFLREFLREQNRDHPKSINADAMAALENHHWPGEVRELQTYIQKAAIECPGEEIDVMHLDKRILDKTAEESRAGRKISAKLWNQLRAEDRNIVANWPEIAEKLKESLWGNNGDEKINYSKAGLLMQKAQIPLTKVQVTRLIKPAIELASQTRTLDEVFALHGEELAGILMEARKLRRNNSNEKKPEKRARRRSKTPKLSNPPSNTNGGSIGTQ